MPLMKGWDAHGIYWVYNYGLDFVCPGSVGYATCFALEKGQAGEFKR